MKRSIMLILLVAGIQLVAISYRMHYIKSHYASNRGFTRLPANIEHVRIIDSTANYLEYVIKEMPGKSGFFVNDPMTSKNLSREVRGDTLILRMKDLNLMSDYGRTLTVWLPSLSSLDVAADITIEVSAQFKQRHKNINLNVDGRTRVIVAGLKADSIFLTTSLVPDMIFNNDNLHLLRSSFRKSAPGITMRNSLIDQVSSIPLSLPITKK
jgi:hypothetical protein